MSEVVLVTGAAGFIGSHLTERLLGLGHQVIGLDNFDDCYPEATKRDNIRGLAGEDAFRMVEGDIRDAALVARIMSENSVSKVIHLAARAGVRPSLQQPLLYEDVNIAGTIAMLEASRTGGVRQFILASSSSVYGINTASPFSEDANISCPVSPYAASKAAAELFCRTYSHLYGLPIIALRLFTVYGPRQRPEMAIHRFVRMVDNGEEVTLFGDDTCRDYTYVDDIVSGFQAALDHTGETFQILNLGGGRATNLRRLIALIEEALGKKARVRHCPPPPGEVPLTLADISRAKALLGYHPRTGIDEGIGLFVQWYLEHRR